MHRSDAGPLGSPAQSTELELAAASGLVGRPSSSSSRSLGDDSLSTGSREPRPVCVTVWRRVEADVAEAFDTVVPIDLTRIFRGYGPLPAVVGASAAPGGERWGREGHSRTVSLRGGARMEETVIEAQGPGLFRYRVVPVAGPLRRVVRQIDGRFIFARSEYGGTVIRWTYAFHPRPGARPFVRLLAPLWHRYATRVMQRIADEF